MAIETLRQVVALNQRISDDNDDFVHQFQQIVRQLEAGRESMMKNAALLQNISSKGATSTNTQT